jgi:hypothetical protein
VGSVTLKFFVGILGFTLQEFWLEHDRNIIYSLVAIEAMADLQKRETVNTCPASEVH